MKNEQLEDLLASYEKMVAAYQNEIVPKLFRLVREAAEERNAAVRDLRMVRSCTVCAHDCDDENCPGDCSLCPRKCGCRSCKAGDGWEWRGKADEKS